PRLAAALSKAAERVYDPRRLDLQRAEFSRDASLVTVLLDGKTWDCNLLSYEVTPAAKPLAAGTPDRARRNRQPGEDVEVTFENRTADAVELWWKDPSGEKHSYGKIAAGESKRQHTYVGHEWIVIDSRGKTLGEFKAGERTRFVISTPGDKPPGDDDDNS